MGLEPDAAGAGEDPGADAEGLGADGAELAAG